MQKEEEKRPLTTSAFCDSKTASSLFDILSLKEFVRGRITDEIRTSKPFSHFLSFSLAFTRQAARRLLHTFL